MIVVTGTFEIGESDVDAAKAAAIAMVAETEKEDGCICYRFYQDIGKPNFFRVYEEWQSDEALATHFKAPHMAIFREALGKINLIERNVKKFEAGEATQL